MKSCCEIILSRLLELQIGYARLDHEPICSVQEGQKIARYLGVKPCKCLLLCTRHKDYFMVLLPGDKGFSAKDVSRQVGCPHLSFASDGDLAELLCTVPGAVSPLGLLFDVNGRVCVLVDREIAESEYVICHPNDNSCTLRLKVADLLGCYLPATGHSGFKTVML